MSACKRYWNDGFGGLCVCCQMPEECHYERKCGCGSTDFLTFVSGGEDGPLEFIGYICERCKQNEIEEHKKDWC
jgi:hypothetical protein